MKSILLITGAADRHRYFAKKLYDEFQTDLISIISQKLHNTTFVSKSEKIKKLFSLFFKNPFKTIKKIIFYIFNSFYSYKENIFQNSNVLFPDVPVNETNDINSNKMIQLIKSIKPDIIIVFGGKIICKEIINIPKIILNSHYGIVPFYKGIGSSITAIGRKDFRHIGSSIHEINERLDSGDILRYAQPSLLGNETAEKIIKKVINAGLDAYIEVIKHIRSGRNIRKFKQPDYGKIYYSKNPEGNFYADKARIELRSNNLLKYYQKVGLIKENINNKFSYKITNKINKLNNRFFNKKIRNGVYVVLYHHIESSLDNIVDWKSFFGNKVLSKITTDSSILAEHIEYYKKNFTVISLSKAVDVLKKYDGKIPDRYLVITFDDGYKSVLKNTFNILKKIPFTLFVNGNPILKKIGLDRLRIGYFLQNNYSKFIDNYHKVFGNENIFDDFKNNFTIQKASFVRAYWENLVPEKDKLKEMDFYLSIDDIKNNETFKNGFLELGNHTYSHCMLSKVNLLQKESEIIKCHLELEKAFEKKINFFSYPFGGYKSFDLVSELLVMQLPWVNAVSAYGYFNEYYYPTNLQRIGFTNQSTIFVKSTFASYQ